MTFGRHHFSTRTNAAPPGVNDIPVIDAAEFAAVRLGMDLDPKQAEVLRAEPHRAILNCSRQWGKSSVAAIKAAYRATTRPESLVLIASPSERQSKELVRKTARIARQLGLAVKATAAPTRLCSSPTARAS